MFGGNVQYNRGGGGRTYRGGGGVQIPQEATGMFRRRLAINTVQHQEGKVGVGAAQEVATERGGGAGSLGKVLPHVSSGGALVWSGDMGAFSTNDAEVRGSTCGFPAPGHKKTGNAEEGWVLAVGDGKNSPTGSRDTDAPDICGQATGNSGGVGGPTAYF